MKYDEPVGCTNHSCELRLKKSRGMHTNGGCKCVMRHVMDFEKEQNVKRALRWYKQEITVLRSAVAKCVAGGGLSSEELTEDEIEALRRARDESDV